MNKNFINSKIRLFTLQTKDPGMICKPDLTAGYLISLLVDKIGMNFFNISLEVIYPFKKYADFLYKNIKYFEEEYFIFFLENYYHSSNYGLGYLIEILNKIKENNGKNKIIIHSFKLGENEAKDLMKKYEFIELIIRTDSEYFFNELLFNKTPLEEIPNILYRNKNNEIIINKTEEVTYNLGDYLLGGYYNGYIFRLTQHPDYVAGLIDEDDNNTNNKVYYNISKSKYLIDFKGKDDLMLATGRGCKYKCIYCYRGVKYSSVRQIPLSIIKKDLDYLSSIGIKSINLYDDCFLTTNINRLKEIVELLSNYDITYRIAIRYEICSTETFEILKNMNLGSVQIGLQSISKETNKLIKRNINEINFKNIIQEFKKRGIGISIDIILGLPGETLKDFINTYNYVLAFMPNRIAVNTLFINPGIVISTKELKEKYGIKLGKRKDSFIDNYKVKAILESSIFPKKDMLKAREYIKKTMDKFPFIKIVLR